VLVQDRPATLVRDGRETSQDSTRPTRTRIEKYEHTRCIH
jgi:hypothetical protein